MRKSFFILPVALLVMIIGFYSCQAEIENLHGIGAEQVEFTEKSGGGVIVHVHIGRKSRNCFRLGVCDACLFCCPHCNVIIEIPTPPNQQQSINPIVDLLLPSPIEEYDSDEDTTLYIEDTIIVEDSEEYIIRIIEGEYDYDSEMGEYGGYRIEVFIGPIE